jgi:hypothetical protein
MHITRPMTLKITSGSNAMSNFSLLSLILMQSRPPVRQAGVSSRTGHKPDEFALVLRQDSYGNYDGRGGETFNR